MRICACGHRRQEHYGFPLSTTSCFRCVCPAFREREKAIDQALGKCAEALDRHERKKRSPLYPWEAMFAELDKALAKDASELLSDPNYRDVTWHHCWPGCGCAYARLDVAERRLAQVETARDNETIGALAWKERADRADADAKIVALEFAKMREQRDELRAWKEGAISVSPPLQEIGRELGLVIGDSIHDKILPGLRALKRSRDEWMNREGQATFKLNEITKERDRLVNKILNDAQKLE